MLAEACVYAIMVDRAAGWSIQHFLEVKANMSCNRTPHILCSHWIAIFLITLPAAATSAPEQGQRRSVAQQGERFAQAQADLEGVSLRGLKRTIRDLMKRFPRQYAKGPDYLQAAERFERDLAQIRKGLGEYDVAAIEQVQQIVTLQRKALLDNPLLDFDRLLVIKRKPLGNPPPRQGR